MPTRSKESYSIQSVDNALDLLEALCEEGDEIRVAQLSKRLGMTKMSLFRYLATFENRGYVEKVSNSHKYRLGLAAYEIGQKLLSSMGLLRKAKPVIEQLARKCNEALYLVVARGKDILMLDMVDTTQQVRIIPLVGSRYPITASSAGRVMLAHSAQHRSNCSDDDLVRLEDDLSAIMKRGGDCESGSFGEGIASLSVPLIDGQGSCPGGLCMVGPAYRFTEKRVKESLLPDLIEAGVVVSSKLGHVGHFTN